MEFLLKDEDFIYEVAVKGNEDSLSHFDRVVRERWTAAVDAGLCRYRLGDLQTKTLPGKFGLVAQVNTVSL